MAGGDSLWDPRTGCLQFSDALHDLDSSSDSEFFYAFDTFPSFDLPTSFDIEGIFESTLEGPTSTFWPPASGALNPPIDPAFDLRDLLDPSLVEPSTQATSSSRNVSECAPEIYSELGDSRLEDDSNVRPDQPSRDSAEIRQKTLELNEKDRIAIARIKQMASSNIKRNQSNIKKRSKQLERKEMRKPCLRCFLQHQKCVGAPACDACSLRLPRQVCTPLQASGQPIFQKWNDRKYQSQLQWSSICWSGDSDSVNIEVYHYGSGPSLIVKGRSFQPTNDEKTKLWGKTKTGWVSTETPALGLYEYPANYAVPDYISACVPYCLEHAPHVGIVKAMAVEREGNLGLLDDATRLWTATHLLLRGWQARDMALITEQASPYYNMRPAARVMQNALDFCLESYTAQLEKQLLTKIDQAIKERKQRTCWEEIFSAILILLAVMEKDIWRLMYWVRHNGQSYKWRHPNSARYLINRAVFQANILIGHLRLAGNIPALFRDVDFKFPSGTASILYAEDNDNSMYGTLVRNAMKEDEMHDQVTESEFS